MSNANVALRRTGDVNTSRRRFLLNRRALLGCDYLPGLGSLEIKGEEGRRILPAITMIETGTTLSRKSASEPLFPQTAAVNWLVAASFKLTGVRNEWTARLPSALCVSGRWRWLF